jgi:Rrf2 family protein
MRVSAKAEYACIAMLELTASFGSGEPVQIRKIAERHGIPSRFLVQILLQLKGAGYVNSTRGASGGYELVRAPGDITLAEVLQVIEGPGEAVTTGDSADSPATRVLHDCWQEVSALEQKLLRKLTFAELLERVRRQTESMYYI